MRVVHVFSLFKDERGPGEVVARKRSQKRGENRYHANGVVRLPSSFFILLLLFFK